MNIVEARHNMIAYLQTSHPELLAGPFSEAQATAITAAIEILVREIIASEADTEGGK